MHKKKEYSSDRSLWGPKLREGKRKNSGEIKWLKGHLRCYEAVLWHLIYRATSLKAPSVWTGKHRRQDWRRTSNAFYVRQQPSYCHSIGFRNWSAILERLFSPFTLHIHHQAVATYPGVKKVRQLSASTLLKNLHLMKKLSLTISTYLKFRVS